MIFKRNKKNPYQGIDEKRSPDMGKTNPLPITFKRRRKGIDSVCGLCHYMFLMREDKKAPDASGFCPEGNCKVDRLSKACEYYKQAVSFTCYAYGYWQTWGLCYRYCDERKCSGCPYRPIIIRECEK